MVSFSRNTQKERPFARLRFALVSSISRAISAISSSAFSMVRSHSFPARLVSVGSRLQRYLLTR